MRTETISMCCERHLEIPGVSKNTTGTLEQKKTKQLNPGGPCNRQKKKTTCSSLSYRGKWTVSKRWLGENLTLKMAPGQANSYLVGIAVLRRITPLLAVRPEPFLHGLCTNKSFPCRLFQNWKDIFVSPRNLDFYKWCVFKSAQCIYIATCSKPLGAAISDFTPK